MKKRINKVILMGRKPGAAKALRYLLDNNITVALVVADENESTADMLTDAAKKAGVHVYHDDKKVYDLIKKGNKIVSGIDLVISYLYWRKIKIPLISLGRLGCINFHPAPLPDYKSRAGYNTAILEQRSNFGVSVHYIDSEEFDNGPIIKVSTFPINPEIETAYTLEATAQQVLFQLFCETIEQFQSGKKIQTKKNEGGLYLTKKDLEKMKLVDLENDTADMIDRKIRAFFFPPYNGATIEKDEKHFTLISEDILKFIKKFL